MDRYVLFFPSEISNEWIGEARAVYHTRDAEDSILALLKELALGPMGLRLEPAVPNGTAIRSILLREKILYLDFTAHLAISQQAFQMSFSEMLEGIRKSIFYNFPSIEEVFIYIAGSPAEINAEKKPLRPEI
jgi:hypothetical protein